MNKVFHISLCCLIIITGCSSTHHLKNYRAIAKNNYGRNTLVKLHNGNTIEGRFAEIGTDSSGTAQTQAEEGMYIATSQIREIHFQNRGRGALEGLAIGFLSGASISGSWFALTGGKDFSGHQVESDVIVNVVLSSAGIYGLLGAALGAAIGHTDEYLIHAWLPNGYILLTDAEMMTVHKQTEKICHSENFLLFR